MGGKDERCRCSGPRSCQSIGQQTEQLVRRSPDQLWDKYPSDGKHARQAYPQVCSRPGKGSPIQLLTKPGPGYTSPDQSPPTRPLRDWLVNVDDIPLAPIDKDKDKRPYTLHDETSDDDDEADVKHTKALKRDGDHFEEARRLIRTLTNGHHISNWHEPPRQVPTTQSMDKPLTII